MKILVGFLLFVFFTSVSGSARSLTARRWPLIVLCCLTAFVITRHRFI